jgi:hypothetical protein
MWQSLNIGEQQQHQNYIHEEVKVKRKSVPCANVRIMPCRRMGASGGRGERVNGSHLREMQEKTKSIRKVRNVHKRAFCLQGILLKCAV